ncbi:MarR family winged helix-turn-helix transcriptional regulator [Bacillus sp. S/N-304-OC-R1]|uniref:MarR family winged helix-turn-helix transcriptional regulator n=1 Tax=Bacillus sp. S/N-304-OC-R1 TaxID=2758034 RepID=UPI001C8D61E9|nr:MarR family transcriptional regulator [Bacillus sp. S/N-304-OC-R1]MBY0121554.1 MarR family transcriptional regulator [Bacillus sp. S/N-304-OC-R1]
MEKGNHLFFQFEHLFWDVSRNMGYIWKQIFENSFPGSQSYIMFKLEQSGRMRMSKLADSLHLTPGAVTIASDKLIDQGYIIRIRDDKDRRVVYLELTQDGKEALNELRNGGRQIMRSVFNGLSEADLQRLIEIFERATANLNIAREEFDK